MAVPKRKKSKSRIRTRKRAQALRARVFPVKLCPQCGQPHESHRVCPACGYYRGRQVIIVATEKE